MSRSNPLHTAACRYKATAMNLQGRVDRCKHCPHCAACAHSPEAGRSPKPAAPYPATAAATAADLLPARPRPVSLATCAADGAAVPDPFSGHPAAQHPPGVLASARQAELLRGEGGAKGIAGEGLGALLGRPGRGPADGGSRWAKEEGGLERECSRWAVSGDGGSGRVSVRGAVLPTGALQSMRCAAAADVLRGMASE